MAAAYDDDEGMPDIDELTPAECERLLRASVFGRVVIAVPERPEVFPVNYATIGEAILVRTEPGSILDRWAGRAPMLVEIDQVDYDRWQGWSVVARCTAERVADGGLTEAERAAPGPPRWVTRDRSTFVRLRWDELSGRRLGAGRDVMAQLPVARAW